MIREQYKRHGVLGYYNLFSDQYHNPHSDNVVALLDAFDFTNFKVGLDFSCGDGLVSKTLPDIDWVGVDPFMGDRYESETGNKCISASMEQIVMGEVSIPNVDVIVCSYCLDIFEKSYIEMLLYRFHVSSNALITIRPNNKVLRSQWWELDKFVRMDKSRMSIYKHRV